MPINDELMTRIVLQVQQKKFEQPPRRRRNKASEVGAP